MVRLMTSPFQWPMIMQAPHFQWPMIMQAPLTLIPLTKKPKNFYFCYLYGEVCLLFWSCNLRMIYIFIKAMLVISKIILFVFYFCFYLIYTLFSFFGHLDIIYNLRDDLGKNITLYFIHTCFGPLGNDLLHEVIL